MTDGKYSARNQPISTQELASLVATELQLADNDNNSEIIGNASDAYNYFLLREKGDEEPNKSSVQDGTVADVIDSIMAEIQPMYTVEQLCEIKQEGPQDTTSEQETKALNWYFRERLRGFELLDETAQNMLLLRNGFLKIWPETSWRLPYIMTMEGTQEQIDMQLAPLVSQGAIVKVYEDTVQIIKEAQYATEIITDTETFELVESVVEVQPQVISVDVMIIKRTKEVKGATIAREDFGTSQDAVNQNLQRNRFNYNRRRMTRNQAIALGFYQGDIYNLENEDVTANQVDNEREEGIRQVRDSTAADTGGDIVSIFECWYQVDADGDGIAELHQIYYGRSNRILRWADPETGEAGEYADEIVRVVPVASMVALRVANRHLGRSIFDKQKSNEDNKRILKRQMNDNLYAANDREFILGTGASYEDFELGFSGGYKRARDVNQVKQIDYNPIINESLQALAYYDTVVSDRGGQALESSSQTKPTNVQASTFERWMTATERTTAMYMRNFSDGIRDAFVLLHMALKTLEEPFDYEDEDGWKTAEPRFWMDRERISVTLGKSEGERMRLIGSYDQQLNRAAEAAQNGGEGVITDWGQRYEMLTEQANLMGVKDNWLDPNRIVAIDPQTGQPITAVQAAQQSQAQAAQQQAAYQEAQSDKMLALQAQIVTLQEETKRLKIIQDGTSDARDSVQKGLDSTRQFVTDQTKLELEYSKDLPGGVAEGDENLASVVTQ